MTIKKKNVYMYIHIYKCIVFRTHEHNEIPSYLLREGDAWQQVFDF